MEDLKYSCILIREPFNFLFKKWRIMNNGFTIMYLFIIQNHINLSFNTNNTSYMLGYRGRHFAVSGSSYE